MALQIEMRGLALSPEFWCDFCGECIDNIEEGVVLIDLGQLQDFKMVHGKCVPKTRKYDVKISFKSFIKNALLNSHVKEEDIRFL